MKFEVGSEVLLTSMESFDRFLSCWPEPYMINSSFGIIHLQAVPNPTFSITLQAPISEVVDILYNDVSISWPSVYAFISIIFG